MSDDKTASEQIDARIAELGDWRAETLARLRVLIHEAVPDVEEGWKWRGVPTFEKVGPRNKHEVRAADAL